MVFVSATLCSQPRPGAVSTLTNNTPKNALNVPVDGDLSEVTQTMTVAEQTNKIL